MTAEVIEARLREMEGEGAAPASVEHLRRTLRTVFNRARKSRVWMMNPAADAHPRSMEPRRVQQTLDEGEVPIVLGHVEDPWKRDLVATAIYTGMRKGELFALRCDAVHLDVGTIAISRSHGRETTKGGHSDTIPIAQALKPFLALALDATPSELVFPAPDGGWRRDDFDAVAIVRTALKRAGIVEVSITSLAGARGAARAVTRSERRMARSGGVSAVG